jgi:tripartite-type tricarboxylate transporter receptor subunit TctC
MNRDLESVLSQTEVAQRLQSLGSQAEPRMTVAQFDAFMRSERERWGKVVKAVGITPE